MSTAPAVQMEILAKVVTGPDGERKVDAGMRFHPVPETMELSLRWVRKYLNRPEVVTVEGLTEVTRPSRPDPDYDENGSATVAAGHHTADEDNPIGLPGPHRLLHATAFIFHTPDGDLRYEVTRQPDKYVAGDTDGTQRVTAEEYAAGNTEVEHYFTLRLTDTTKKG